MFYAAGRLRTPCITLLTLSPSLALVHDRFRSARLRCDLEQAKNKVSFPETLNIKNASFRLVSSGVRKVTFLSISVYDIGIYVAENDLPHIISAIRSLQIDSPEELRQYLMDPDKGTAFFNSLEGVSFAIRIVPVRNTDIAHMRDGFVRGILARQEPEENSLQAFKEFFPNPRRAFLKQEVMLLTLWQGRELKLDIGGHDYGVLQLKDTGPTSLLRAFLGTYISGKKVASEEVRMEFVQQICSAS